MPNKSKKLTGSPLEMDLLHFYDAFAEFHDHCCFLCDAFACLAMEDDVMDSGTAMGGSRFSHGLKLRVQELKQDLKKIHEKARAQKKRVNKTQNQKPMLKK